MKKGLINEAKRLQQLAGLIKEDFNVGLQKEQQEADSIAVAFQQAGIDLNKPVVYIGDRGNPSGTDKPLTMSGAELLSFLEGIQDEYDYEVTDDVDGISFEFAPRQGMGELLGDDAEETQGLTCKLNVYFEDAMLFEIWQ